MDKVKINKAIDALGLSVNHKNTLKEALNQGAGEGMIELEDKVDSIDKELGTAKADINSLGAKVNNFINANEIVELAIGNDAATKAANIAKLGDTQHTFFTSINYGYGTASWIPTDGGNAFIVTDEGHAVTYKISTDGAVTKLSEFTLAKPTEYTLPAATKTTLGGVKAITNIVNVDTETATVGSLAGVINTLLNQLRAAGIIQL
nr:MAG TPA: Head fiber protein [Crassvirales sp.]